MSFILAFAGSNSSKSINYELVKYTCSLIHDHDIRMMNMYNYSFPMYGEDHEHEYGFSDELLQLKSDIQLSRGIVLSVNEHNGNPSAYFKNLIDWLSRIDRDFIRGKSVMLTSTSNGKRGAKGALEVTEKLLTRFGAELVGTFSLPGYSANFHPTEGILNSELAKQHKSLLTDFLKTIG